MQQETQYQPPEQSPMLTDRRWKLKADAFFVRTSDGVELRNNKGSYRVHGKAAYALIDWIFQRFQNTASLDELCAGMPSEKRAVVEHQVETLAARGFLRQVALPPERIPLWAEAFSDLIAFIYEFEDAPFSRFQTFREKRFLCAGRGLAMIAFLETLAVYGVKKVGALIHQDDVGVIEAIAALQERINLPEFDVRINKPWERSQEEDVFLSQNEEYDCGLLACRLDAMPASGNVYASILGQGKPFSVIGYLGDIVVASPLFLPGSDLCWECICRSIFHQPSLQGPQGPTPTALALACNHVIHNLFCYYTEVNRSLLSYCAVVNSNSLQVSTHLVARHPACPNHTIEVSALSFDLDHDRDYIRPDLPNSDDPAELIQSQDQIISWSNHLTHGATGPFLALGEGDLPQLPLSRSRCVVRAFASVAGAVESCEIIAAGISTRETRNQVALFGLEYLADEALHAQTSVALELLNQLNASVSHGSDSASIATVGAGWSAGEAIYRALHRNALSWALGIGLSQLRVGEIHRRSPIIQYFASVCPKLLEPGLTAHLGRARSGMAVARLSTHSDGVVWGAGLNEIQACENAAAELATRHCGDENGSAVLRSVYILRETGPWLDALQRNGIALPSHLDARALLPDCYGKAFLALLKL